MEKGEEVEGNERSGRGREDKGGRRRVEWREREKVKKVEGSGGGGRGREDKDERRKVEWRKVKK